MDALAGNFDDAQWIQIWDGNFDTHVLDTSAQGNQSSNACESSGICHDFDSEAVVHGKQSYVLVNPIGFWRGDLFNHVHE
jgi:hypothetical protein